MQPSIWAHRGASADAPENSLAAFELAVEQGADGVELDVQRSADGHLVVCHDETVERTTSGHGAVVGLAVAQLRALGVPTLDEVFALLAGNDVLVNVELKNSIEPYPGMEQQVLELVAAQGLAERVWLSSFNHVSLHRLAGLGSRALAGVRLGMLYGEPLHQPWRLAVELGVQAVHPSWQSLLVEPDEQVVQRCHESGLAVHPWTVDGDAELAALTELGVDAVITNRPRWARGVTRGLLGG